ncbi:MAG: fold metallo-hydrolase [Verrucomicrobiaceae bacterium]|nr:fold metallo-hydrolase [Verrucomicrobiaceae bacterium]
MRETICDDLRRRAKAGDMIAAFQTDAALLADIDAASAEPDCLHLWWLGQSGFLLRHGGSFLLLDPYLSDSLTLKYAATDKPHVRMTERCIAPEALDFVKLIISSHQHTDHFDEATLLPLVERAGPVKLVVPAAVEDQARARVDGHPAIEFIPLDDGQSTIVDGWWISAVAAAHNEVERDDEGRCKFLGYVVQRSGFSVYHSGDTLWHPALVGSLLPFQCDLALVPVNGSKPERRVAGNLNGTEAAALARAIGARLAVPHHFDMFAFNTEPPDEFVNTCARLSQPCQVLRCGERLTLQK